MTPAVVAFISKVEGAASTAALWDDALAFCRGYGLEHIIYGYLSNGPNQPHEAFQSTLPEAEARAWIDGNSKLQDPRLQYVCDSLLPRCFDRSELGGFENVMNSCVVIPLRCIIRVANGSVILGGSLSKVELERTMAEHGASLLLAIYHFDLRMQQLSTHERLAKVKLTTRETQCLELLSQGMKNDRIAHTLGISEVTVRLHFTNARTKLQTMTREAAVVRAAVLGLIQGAA